MELSLTHPARTPWLRHVGALLAVALLAGCATLPPDVAQRTRPASEILHSAHRAKGAAAIGLYLEAAQTALAIVEDKSATPAAREEATRLYNEAATASVLALREAGTLQPGRTAQTFTAGGRTYSLTVTPAKGHDIANPATYDKLIDSTTVFRKHIKEDVRRAGLGGTLVGLLTGPSTESPNRPPKGFALPLTAVLDFPTPSKKQAATPVKLTIYNSQERETVTLQGTKYPLAGDFTASLAFFPRTRNLVLGFVAMMNSDRVSRRSNIYFCEPYDPDKIPIIFVHGLMSSPQAWINFINELDRNPEFRRRYQPWVYFYPSGAPIAANATRLRRDLAAVAERYPLKRNIVMVGHSMGGILTRMQVTDTGRKLWDSIFRSKADALWKHFPEDGVLKRALVFQPNPYVTRAVFFSAPHQGSNLANMRISSLVASLIRLPSAFRQEFNSELRTIVRDLAPQLRASPTSIVGLSPRSPLLQGMSKLPIAVPFNSIIGNQGHNNVPLEKSSDSVVPYWSSHVPGAESELIVPTGHDSFDCPQSVAEMLRILGLDK